MTSPIVEVSWPASRLGEAIQALGQRIQPGIRPVVIESPPASLIALGGERLGPWIETVAGRLDLEAEPVEASYTELGELLCRCAPALLRLRDPSETRFLVVLHSRQGRVTLLTPEFSQVQFPQEAVGRFLCRELEGPVAGLVDGILAEAGVKGQRKERARQALLCELLVNTRIGGCWLLRLAPNTSFGVQARESQLPRWFFTLLGTHAAEYSLWILSWWLLGWMTLQGRLDAGWLAAWLLVLMTLVPFRLLATRAGGQLSIRVAALIKRRLLFGALQLEPDEIRHLGVGQLLGRVLESEAIEALALTGGFLAVTALVELVLASFVLAAGAGSWVHLVLLLATAVITSWLGYHYCRRRQGWTDQRLAMTDDLVERMVGHRTRLAQKAREHWNEGEDQALERYLDVSRRLDHTGVALQVFVPRGWLIAGLLGLAPAFITGNRAPVVLAIGLGGIILAYRALRNLVDGLDRLAGAAIAWGRIKLFWQAAARQVALGEPGLTALSVPAVAASDNGRPLLDGRDLVFQYRDRPQPVLQGTTLQICAGDRLLLEGPSGGGKSTLAALLAGCRAPTSGLLLLHGLDRDTLGVEGWRRRVVIAPQFHENHVLMGTFAFNALMGRAWPPRQGDLEEAEAVCRALGLGPLLDRMPAGSQQLVGETGWQLSHGERSRLYIARALLQGADLIILDESFAALDPKTLERTLAFVLEKAPTVLVVAHP